MHYDFKSFNIDGDCDGKGAIWGWREIHHYEEDGDFDVEVIEDMEDCDGCEKCYRSK